MVVAAILSYALSPIELIPDFIPIIGYIDDLVLIPLGIVLAIRPIPQEVLTDYRLCVLSLAAQKMPVSWIAGAVIIFIWTGLIIYFLLRLLD